MLPVLKAPDRTTLPPRATMSWLGGLFAYVEYPWKLVSVNKFIGLPNSKGMEVTDGRLLFVEERHEQNRLTGVLISDRTDPTQPFTVVAERGRFSFDSKNAIAHLQLEEGAPAVEAK